MNISSALRGSGRMRHFLSFPMFFIGYIWLLEDGDSPKKDVRFVHGSSLNSVRVGFGKLCSNRCFSFCIKTFRLVVYQLVNIDSYCCVGAMLVAFDEEILSAADMLESGLSSSESSLEAEVLGRDDL